MITDTYKSAQRWEMLIGERKLALLSKANVMIVGIGGVGSYACEALGRAQVKTLQLVDHDKIDITNLNRQIHADYTSLNIFKTQAMRERLLTYRRDCEIIEHRLYLKEDTITEIFKNKPDFVIDAIDTISSKFALIMYCLQHDIPLISCMGVGNRMDPNAITIKGLMQTRDDPVARALRLKMRKANINKQVIVCCSSEIPKNKSDKKAGISTDNLTKVPPASSPFVPAAAGLACASYAVQEIIKNDTR